VLLRGLGEYKRGIGGDRSRFLALWSGAPWTFSRVGAKGGKKNAVSLRIPRPTLVICGGLQSALHDLLGGDEDGLRPRWLPHLAATPAAAAFSPPSGWEQFTGQTVARWGELLERLVEDRDRSATYSLSRAAHAAFRDRQHEWKVQAAHRSETASTSAALSKADIHLARIALVLYAADRERPEEIEEDHVHRAARIVDFVLDCWRALPEAGGLALSRRDEQLDRAITRLIGWLEEHGGEATRRELQRACVAGARTCPGTSTRCSRATTPSTPGPPRRRRSAEEGRRSSSDSRSGGGGFKCRHLPTVITPPPGPP
jgi:Protein of unknown function (DUF3987)